MSNHSRIGLSLPRDLGMWLDAYAKSLGTTRTKMVTEIVTLLRDKERAAEISRAVMQPVAEVVVPKKRPVLRMVPLPKRDRIEVARRRT